MDRMVSVKNALPIVASVYGQKFGVKVVIGNFDTAMTDGKTIALPAVAADYQHMDALWGFLAHEAAHVRYTDFGVNKDSRGRLFASFLNIVEDGRIELAMADVFPGTRKTLEACTAFGLAQSPCRVSPDASLEQVLFMYAYHYMYANINGYGVARKDLPMVESALHELVSDAVVMKAQMILDRVATAKSTQDCADIAEALMTMLKEEAENPSKPQQPQDSDDSSESSDDSDQSDQSDASGQSGDDDQSDSTSGGDSGSDDSDQGDGDQSGPQGSDEDDDADADSSGSNDPQGQSDNGDTGDQSGDDQKQQNLQQMLAGDGAGGDAFDMHQVVRDAIEADAEDSYNQATGDGAAYVQSIPDAQFSSGNGSALVADAKAVSSRIRKDLIAMLQAQARVERRTTDRGRKVRGNKLHRLAVGNPNVFRHKSRAQKVDTAVHLLVDLSGSMEGVEAEVAKQCGAALAMALEGIPGANPAITYFGGYEQDAVKVALRHGQKLAQATSLLNSGTWGCTPMAEAIWFAAAQLEQTRNAKKMLVVISDGGPDDPQRAKYAVDLLQRGGYHLLGIGIKSAAIERYIDNSITIDSVHDLIGTLFSLVGDALAA
jgi:Mg-chelatase subunit ChlD